MRSPRSEGQARGDEPSEQGALRFELPAVEETVPEARSRVSAWAEGMGLSDAELHALQLAVNEAVTSAVLHAYRDLPPGSVLVHGRRRDNRLLVSVEDFGVGMKPRPDSPGLGLGLPLIARLVSGMAIVCMPERDSGTEIRIILRCGPGAAVNHV